MPVRDGRAAVRNVGALRPLADHRSRALRLLRLSPQQAAWDDPPSGAVKLHTKIVLGLVLGAASGIAANTLAPRAAWVRWIRGNVARAGAREARSNVSLTVAHPRFASNALRVLLTGAIE